MKAGLKEAAVTTGQQRDPGNRGSRQVWQTGVIVTEPGRDDFHSDGKIRFEDENGNPVTEPDGTLEAVVHVWTPQGPRTSIKLNDYVNEGRRIRFRIWVLDLPREKRDIDDEYMASVLANMQMGGLGADRSQSFGRFKVIEFVRHEAAAKKKNGKPKAKDEKKGKAKKK